MRLRRAPSLFATALFALVAPARAQVAPSRSASAEPGSFLEHFERRTSLTAPLVVVRHHAFRPGEPFLRSVCAFGERESPPRVVRVTTPDGRPARGAFVVRSMADGTPLDVVVTDDDGIVRLDAGPDDVLRIELDGHLTAADVRLRERERVDVELTPGVELLRGRVFDPAQEPIIGAEVVVDAPGVGSWRAWTDSWGQYRVLAKERVTLPRGLSFHVRDFWRRPFLGDGRAFTIEREPGRDSVELTLLDLRTVAFDVVDASGRLVLDSDVRVAWDREHARRFEFPFDSPAVVAPFSRSEAIATTVRGIPAAVPLWVEVLRGGRTLAVAPLELPLDPSTPRFVTPRVEVHVASLPERLRGAVFQVVDARHEPQKHVGVALVLHRVGGDVRERISVDDLARLRIDERDVETTLEVSVRERLVLQRRIPARFDSAQIVELVVDAR